MGVLSSSVWVLNHNVGFSWQPQSKKPFNRLNVLFWGRALVLQSFYFLCFLSGRKETLQQARNVRRVNSQIPHDATFVHYPFFVLNVPLFSLFIKLSLIGIFFHCLTAHDERRTRQYTRQGWKYSSRQNDVIAGETSGAFALLLAFAAENIKKPTTRTREKIWAWLVGKFLSQCRNVWEH